MICGLLFAATTINYVDRQVLGVLAPTLQKQIGFDERAYGDINAAFSAAYALGLLLSGGLIDRIGTRLGYAATLTLWSLAGAGHALARSAFGFGVARVFLGLAEAGNFPAAVKTVAEWFPRRDRAFATGIFNSGSNVGAVVAPLLVPALTLRFGWQAAFLATGLAGLLWVAFWLPLYRKPREHPALSPEELQYIESDAPDEPTPIAWRCLLADRRTWTVAVARLLTDPVWWFYLFWAAQFFKARFNVDLKSIGPPLVVIYLLADVGSVGGGWLSSALLRRGYSVNLARKLALLVCALCVVPVVAAPYVAGMWSAVFLIGLAAAAHQGFSANLYTIASDLFPRRCVGSVIGIAGMAGAVGSIVFQWSSGRVTYFLHSYTPLFLACGSAYLIALAMVQLITPVISAPSPAASPGH